MAKNKYVLFPGSQSQPESFVLRTTITLSPEIHQDLIEALEAATSKAYVIRELMIKGLKAYQDDLEREAANGN